jgi:hypothetical protein
VNRAVKEDVDFFWKGMWQWAPGLTVYLVIGGRSTRSSSNLFPNSSWGLGARVSSNLLAASPQLQIDLLRWDTAPAWISSAAKAEA